MIFWEKKDLKISSLKRGRCEYHWGREQEEAGTAALAFAFSLFPLPALAEGGIIECL